ncbi:MAG: DNA polymerase III subunit delta [Turicibacter sp.]|nr:DNA polymerase III subunit delta [Turicibacter sp.]
MIYTVLGGQGVLSGKKIGEILKEHKISPTDATSYDMLETPVQEALFDVSSLAFLSPKKAVIIKNPDFLTGAGKSQGHDLDAFVAYLKNPSKDNVLIVHAPYEKLDERKKIVKALRQHSKVHLFETYTDSSLKLWFTKKLNAQNIEYDPRAIDAVIELTGSKIDLMYAELEKIELYFMDSPDRLLTLDVANALMSRRMEDNVFLLTEQLMGKKQAKAHQTYLDLLSQKVDPFQVLILLANQFRLMKQVLRLLASGYPQPEIAKMLGVHPYRVKLIANQSHRFDPIKLESCLATAARMDHEIKTGLLDKNLAVELLILTTE